MLHTLNIRLPAGQVAHIVNHAGDRMVTVEETLLPLFARALPQMAAVEAVEPAPTTT